MASETPPDGALWRIEFCRHGSDVTYGSFSQEPLPDDAEADVLQQLKDAGQNPDEYDLAHAIRIPVTR